MSRTFHLKVSFSTIRNPWIQLTKSPGAEIGSLGSGCCVPHRCGRFIDPRGLQWASSSVARFLKQTLLFSHVFFFTCVLIHDVMSSHDGLMVFTLTFYLSQALLHNIRVRYEQDAAWRMLNQQQVSKYPSDGRGRTRRGELARTISTQALACRSWSQWSLS